MGFVEEDVFGGFGEVEEVGFGLVVGWGFLVEFSEVEIDAEVEVFGWFLFCIFFCVRYYHIILHYRTLYLTNLIRRLKIQNHRNNKKSENSSK